MSNMMEARKTLIAQILEGPGYAPHNQRRAAFNNAGLEEPLTTLIGKVAKRALEVTDEDISTARAASLSEDQIFELVICGAIGQATRQHDNALAALRNVARKV